jgi:hypothetical protein
MPRPLLTLIVICGLSLSLPVTAAKTDDAAGKACGADYQKFCAGVQPGEGRIGRCLQQHASELSTSCRQFLTNATQTLIREFIAACQNDVTQHCSGVQPGEGRVLHCLRDHNDSLSQNCQQLIKKL